MFKKILSLIIVMVIVVTVAACGNSGLSGNGDYISYVKLNNTSAESYEPQELMKNKNEKDHFYSIKLTGLKDKSVQDAVNEAITASVGEFKKEKEPEYSGMKKLDKGRQTGVTIRAEAKGGINNILSVLLTKTIYYEHASCTDVKTISFDLNDGSEIAFDDVFANEKDAAAALSAACISYLEDNDVLEKDGKPEYSKDTQFYFDLDGIHIIHDYSTGGIKTPDFKPIEVVVGFNSLAGVMNIDQYVSDDCIYEDDNIRYMLVKSDAAIEESENNIPDRTNLAMIQYLSWPSDIPDKILKLFMKDAEVSDEEIEAVSDIVKAGSGVYYYNDMADCTRVGNYFNVVRSKSLFGAGIWTEDKICSVYDIKGNNLTLDDLFVNGTDYNKTIIKALKESLSNYYENDSYAGKTLEEVYNGLSFYIDANGIGLWTEALGLKNANGDKHESSVYFFIEYDEFGFENMTLFN